jgi:hypothetical protein
MMVRRYPNVKEEVGDSITGNEISSLPDGKLAKWSTASYALMLARRRRRRRLQENNPIHL